MADVLEELTDLLETERAALGAGKLDELAGLGTRKEELLARVEAGAEAGHPPEGLAPLAEALKRNARLLERAMDGVRDAGRRMDELRAAQRSLRTYDARGQSSEVFRPGRGLSRKA